MSSSSPAAMEEMVVEEEKKGEEVSASFPSPTGKSGDANDYSRFDAMADSDDEEDEEDKKKKEKEDLGLPFEECMVLAVTKKEEGNAFFQSGASGDARASYQAGIKAITDSALTISTSEGKALLCQLHGNSAMASVKAEDWTQALASASACLDIDPNNIKALYRRGLAHSKLKFFVEGRADLEKCIAIDAGNAAAKNALAECVRAQKEDAKKEKDRMAAMFSGKSMYEDREKERNAKIRKEEERQSALRDLWTKSKLEKRALRPEDAEQTFEEWMKDHEKEEKEKKEEEERNKKSASSSAARPVSGKAKSAKVVTSSDDDEETEEDKELLKGYKTLASGKKTSFFHNELDAETKALIGSIAPKKIEVAEANAPSPHPVAIEAEGGAAGSAASIASSAWNHAGTMEERDTTEWCKQRLESLLQEAEYSFQGGETGSIIVKTKLIKDTEGDSQVVITRGKKRYLFDFSCTIELELAVIDEAAANSKNKYKATLKLTDLSPGLEASVVSCKFSKSLPAPIQQISSEATRGFVATLQAKIAQLHEEFQATL